MLKQITITIFVALSLSGLKAQMTADSLFRLADTYFETGEYTHAIEVYQEIKNASDSSQSDYAYAVDRIAMVYYQNRNAAREGGDPQASISYLEEFLAFLDEQKAVLRPNWFEKSRYEIIHLLLQDYFQQNWYESAKSYQAILYWAHEQNKLPGEFQTFYNLGRFSYKGKNVWGYEYFEGLTEPTSRGSLSKVVYAVFSTDEQGEDKDLLYQVHVKQIKEIDDAISEYVLAIRPELGKGVPAGTLWGYEFDELDYGGFRKAIMRIIDGDYKMR